MNFPIPHISWEPKSSRIEEGRNLARKANEDKFLQDFRISCPRVGFQPIKSENPDCTPKSNIQLLSSENSQLIDINLADHLTKPIPLFSPTHIKCGRGPIAKNLLEPNERQRKLLEQTFLSECQLLIENYKDTGINLKRIENAWRLHLEEGRKFPANLESFHTIMEKYACDEMPVESFAGGNLATVRLGDQRFLLHSLMEWDCALCLTRMSSNDIAQPPLDIGHKVPLDDGIIYQITTLHRPVERDPELTSLNDEIFATRQLHTTRLWKVAYDEKKQSPVISCLQEYRDPSSTVRFVQLNPMIWGEFCELRPKKITISRDGYLLFKKEVNQKYDHSCYILHPKVVLLVSNNTADILDTRCHPNGSLHPAFSLSDENFRAVYSISSSDKISCFSQSSRENISFLTTSRHLFVWDIRLGKRPLSCIPHMMDAEPVWMSSVDIGLEKEWLFLDSKHPSSSAAVGFSWGSERFTANSSDYMMSAVNVEIEPQRRLSVLDTLESLQSNGVALDWAVKNRFEQYRTGLVCDKESDGTILVWQCNVAGDIFLQKLDINVKRGHSEESVSSKVSSWMSEWTDSTIELEETPIETSAVYQSEHFGSESIVTELKKGFTEEELKKWRRSRSESSLTSPKFSTTDRLEQYCAEDFTQFVDARGLQYNLVWGLQGTETRPTVEDSFMQEFHKKLVSSTPMTRTGNPNEVDTSFPLKAWLSTPSQQSVKSDQQPYMDPIAASTPFTPNLRSTSSVKLFKKPTVWDDF